MKLLYTAIFLPMLTLLVAGCTSNTALQSSETDDLYYASSDKTTRVEYAVPVSGSGSQTYVTDEVVNPDYSSGTTSGQTSITNNYNYYDDDYGYGVSRRNRTYRNYNSYSYDPFYAPFGYSAAYCYNLYDPFWYPYCYPSPGISISIGYGYGYGYGYPAYGYGFYDRPYGYGYRPYGYGYGGYGGYYQGFYDGYYAGNGYGYGYHRNPVNYAPRRDRASTPSNVPSNNGNTGRPPMPNRQADPNVPNNPTTPGGRPMRTATQPQISQPNRIEGTPANEVRPASRPQRDAQNVRPDNYQFQQGQQLQSAPDNNRPVRGRVTERPVLQNNQNNTAPEVMPSQPERPVRRERSESRPRQVETAPSVPQQQPVQENYRRPERESRPARSNEGGSFNQPSFQHNAPSGGGFERSGGNMGRPRR